MKISRLSSTDSFVSDAGDLKLDARLDRQVSKLILYSHDTTTECHLPYGITQCYLLPDTSEHTPP